MTPILPLPPIQAYRPATFLERGVAVPFTTPLLAGARARHGSRNTVELVLPNPSGGRGVYIVPCASIRSLCRPTVHDSRLNQLISGLPMLTPSTMRRVGLDVASQGLAGRPAMAAAQAAAEKDRQDQVLTKYLLLGTLAEQAAPEEFKGIDWRRQRAPLLEQRAHGIVAQFARSQNQSPEELASALEALTAMFVPIGIAGQWTEARLVRQLRELTELHAGLVERMREPCDDVLFELADMIAARAGPMVATAKRVLGGVQLLGQDVIGLLRTWSKQRERMADLAARPEWLLDGWEQVSLLWRSTGGPDQQRAVLSEMAHVVPVLPREAAQWGEQPPVAGDAGGASDRVSFNREWRAGPAMLNLTARNERLRALAV